MLIRWAIQRGTSVLPKSVHAGRLRSNLSVLGWSLPQEDMEALSRLPAQSRMVGHEQGGGGDLLWVPHHCGLIGLIMACFACNAIKDIPRGPLLWTSSLGIGN